MILKELISSIFDMYKDVVFDGFDFGKEDISIEFQNDLDSKTPAMVLIGTDDSIIIFNLPMIDDVIYTFNVIPDLCIMQTLFHEMAHIWIARVLKTPSLLHDTLIDLCEDKQISDIFSNILNLNHVQTEALCDAISLKISLGVTSPDYHAAIINLHSEECVYHYKNELINIANCNFDKSYVSEVFRVPIKFI